MHASFEAHNRRVRGCGTFPLRFQTKMKPLIVHNIWSHEQTHDSIHFVTVLPAITICLQLPVLPATTICLQFSVLPAITTSCNYLFFLQLPFAIAGFKNETHNCAQYLVT
jgi:hypothetical protein